jgi:hypothetical protein
MSRVTLRMVRDWVRAFALTLAARRSDYYVPWIRFSTERRFFASTGLVKTPPVL